MVDDNLMRHILSFGKLDQNFFNLKRVSRLWNEIVSIFEKECIYVTTVYFDFSYDERLQKRTTKVKKDFTIRNLIFHVSKIMKHPPGSILIKFKSDFDPLDVCFEPLFGATYFRMKDKGLCNILQEEEYGLKRIVMVWSNLPACYKGVRFGLKDDEFLNNDCFFRRCMSSGKVPSKPRK